MACQTEGNTCNVGLHSSMQLVSRRVPWTLAILSLYWCVMCVGSILLASHSFLFRLFHCLVLLSRSSPLPCHVIVAMSLVAALLDSALCLSLSLSLAWLLELLFGQHAHFHTHVRPSSSMHMYMCLGAAAAAHAASSMCCCFSPHRHHFRTCSPTTAH